MNKKIVYGGILIAIVIAIGGYFYPQVTRVVQNYGGTTNYDSLTLSDDLIVGKTSTLTGTTTADVSYDGSTVSGTFTMSTTAPQALYTNTHGPMACYQGLIDLASSTPGTYKFSPSLKVSVGTSTSATGNSLSLLASTTVATGTPTTYNLADSRWVLGSGESVVGLVGDYMTSGASSTNYSNWKVRIAIPCTLLD